MILGHKIVYSNSYINLGRVGILTDAICQYGAHNNLRIIFGTL